MPELGNTQSCVNANLMENEIIYFDSKGSKSLIELPHEDYKRLLSLQKQSPILQETLDKIRNIFEEQAHTPLVIPSGSPSNYALPQLPSGWQQTKHSAESATDIAKTSSVPSTQPQGCVAPAVPERQPEMPQVAKTSLTIKKPDAEPQQTSADEMLTDPLAIDFPPSLISFFEDHDDDGTLLTLFKTYCLNFTQICHGRITLSVHQNNICVWNYEEGIPFVFFCITNNKLHCGLEESFAGDDLKNPKTWSPPKWLFPHSVTYFEVETFTSNVLNKVEKACHTFSHSSKGNSL